MFSSLEITGDKLQFFINGAVLLTVVIIVAVLLYVGRGQLQFGAFRNFLRGKPYSPADEVPDDSPGGRQYKLLQDYHSQGLAQSRISFWFSLIFASLGFFVIIGSLLTLDKSEKFTEQGRSFASFVAGLVIEAVSALFFVQSNRARALMTEFFDKLRADRKLEESLRLAGEIPEATLQSRAKLLLSLNFGDVKLNDALLLSV